MGLPVFGACVKSMYDTVVAFLHRVVVHRMMLPCVTGVVGFWRIYNVRDLGGHLVATRRAMAGTLGCRFSVVLPRIPSVAALSLDFLGKLWLLNTLHIPAALHGVEASAVSQNALRKMRTACVRSVWSDGCTLLIQGQFWL